MIRVFPVRKSAQSGFVLIQAVIVIAVIAVVAGYGAHSWQERQQRAELSRDLARVKSLAYVLDRKYCARTAAKRMTLSAARTDLGESVSVRDEGRWRIHLEMPATGSPGAAVDEYFLLRSPTLAVYRIPRASLEGAHLLRKPGAAAAFVTDGGDTFDTVQVPVVQSGKVKGSHREFQFLMRESGSLDSRC